MALLAVSGHGLAQSPSESPVIGVLDYGARAEVDDLLASFREGLAEGGFVEGRNLRIEFRFAEHDYRKISRLAQELVDLKVRAIYAPLTWGVHAAKAATATIPIVFSGVNDPVALKFVQSLARPGGNITGVTTATNELLAKRMQLMREMFPAAGKLGVVYDGDVARACQIELYDIGRAGKLLGLEMQHYSYQDRSDLRSAFDSAEGAKVAALLVPTSLETRRFGDELLARSQASRIPLIHSSSRAVEIGGLMSYGPERAWAERRAGNYVARILKGARPADLPVERPTRYELVVNLKTARAMGIRVPQQVLARADRVIE